MKMRGWNSKRLWPTFPPLLPLVYSAVAGPVLPPAQAFIILFHQQESFARVGSPGARALSWAAVPIAHGQSLPKTSRARGGKKQQQDITLSNAAPFTPHPTKYLTASPPSHICVLELREMGERSECVFDFGGYRIPLPSSIPAPYIKRMGSWRRPPGDLTAHGGKIAARYPLLLP